MEWYVKRILMLSCKTFTMLNRACIPSQASPSPYKITHDTVLDVWYEVLTSIKLSVQICWSSSVDRTFDMCVPIDRCTPVCENIKNYLFKQKIHNINITINGNAFYWSNFRGVNKCKELKININTVKLQ